MFPQKIVLYISLKIKQDHKFCIGYKIEMSNNERKLRNASSKVK